MSEAATEPVEETGADDPTPEPPTFEELQALNRQQLHDIYDVPLKGSKDDLVDLVLAKYGVNDQTVLEVAWPIDSHTHGPYVIEQTGTAVPSEDVKDIIATAAAQGVKIREVR